MRGNDRSKSDHEAVCRSNRKDCERAASAIGRQVERMECQRGVDQRTLAGEVEHQRAAASLPSITILASSTAKACRAQLICL